MKLLETEEEYGAIFDSDDNTEESMNRDAVDLYTEKVGAAI